MVDLARSDSPLTVMVINGLLGVAASGSWLEALRSCDVRVKGERTDMTVDQDFLLSLFTAFQTNGGVINRIAFLTRSTLRVRMKIDTASSGSCCPAFGLV